MNVRLPVNIPQLAIARHLRDANALAVGTGLGVWVTPAARPGGTRQPREGDADRGVHGIAYEVCGASVAGRA